MSVAVWIVAGLFAGWLATVAMGKSAYGLLGDVVVGVLGAFVGGALMSSFVGIDVGTLDFPSTAVALGGAIIFVAVYRTMVPAEEHQSRM